MGFKSNLYASPRAGRTQETKLPGEKEYGCFICSRTSLGKGVSLFCETTFSSICLGEKLQEILSEKFTILVSPRDTICWDCASCINHIDQYEHKIDVLKDYILTAILSKYKHEVRIPNNAFALSSVEDKKKEVVPVTQPTISNPPKETKPVIPQVAAKANAVKVKRGRGRPPGRKKVMQNTVKPTPAALPANCSKPKKKHLCRFCGHSYSNECSLLSHILQKHPPKFLCEVCDSPFSNKNSYESHMSLHMKNTHPTGKKFKCKICGFVSDSSSAKHSCSDNFKVVTCAECSRECYVSPKFSCTGVFKCSNCKANQAPEPKVKKDDPQPRKKATDEPNIATNGPSKDGPTSSPTPNVEVTSSSLQNHPHEPNPEPENREEIVVMEIDVSNNEELTTSDPEKIPDSKCETTRPQNGADVQPVLPPPETNVTAHPEELEIRSSPFVDGLVVEECSAPPEKMEEEVPNDTSVPVEEIELPVIEEPHPDPKRNDIVSEETGYDNRLINKDILLSTHGQECTEEKDHALETTQEMVAHSIRCPTCEEEVELNNVPTHQCFLEAQVVEYLEDGGTVRTSEEVCQESYAVANFLTAVSIDPADENVVGTIEIVPSNEHEVPEETKTDVVSKLKCKTCDREFLTTNALRHHWQTTGHSWEVDTDYLEFNKIVDKVSNTETTFKVLKQKFNIKTNIPTVQYPDPKCERQENPNVKNMIVRVSDVPKCNKCNVRFPTKEMLMRHSTLNCLTCVTCEVTFLNYKLLRKHYTCTGHSNKVFLDKSSAPNTDAIQPVTNSIQCHVCSKTYNSRFLLSKHLAGHFKGSTRTACQFCLLELDKSEIQNHVLEVHGARLYKCEHCERTFMSALFRDSHQAKHQDQDLLPRNELECRSCRTTFTSIRALAAHNEKTHRGMSCRICGKYITDSYSLKRHENRHYYNKGLQCNMCMKTFRNKVSLDAHNKTHTGEFKFSCDECDRGFMSRSALEEHRIVHINKKYTCNRCGTRCTSRIAYWVHSKMHDCPYSCSVCGRMYRDTSLLAVHRRKHWRVRPYQCPHCPRTFSVPATLRRHLTVHTRAYPHRCALCKKGFLTRYAFHRHLENIHDIRQSSSVRKPAPQRPKVPSLPLSATDEDLFQAADTFIADESVMFVDYGHRANEHDVHQEIPTNEVVVETTELFDELLN